jgi:hypothetical protein
MILVEYSSHVATCQEVVHTAFQVLSFHEAPSKSTTGIAQHVITRSGKR